MLCSDLKPQIFLRRYSHAVRDLIPSSVMIKLNVKCLGVHKLALGNLPLAELNNFEGK